MASVSSDSPLTEGSGTRNVITYYLTEHGIGIEINDDEVDYF